MLMDVADQDEDEFDGDLIADRLSRPGAETIADALIGCRTYRADPEATEDIVSCDPARQRLLVSGRTGGMREVALRGAYILRGDGRLREALAAFTTDADRRAEADARLVASWGFAGRLARKEADVLAAAMRAIVADQLQSRPMRQQVAGLARKYGSPRHVLRFTERWRRLAGNAVPADVLIEHVACLREIGRIDDALTATEVLRRRDHGLEPHALAVLFTQRAALWLDLFDVRGDPSLLKRARESAGRSWAIAPSEQCSAVYGRLGKIGREAQG